MKASRKKQTGKRRFGRRSDLDETMSISPRKAASLVRGHEEAAFFDIREAGSYSRGHPLFAVHLPYSLLEARVGILAPRPGAPIILIDGDDGLSAEAAGFLVDMGYSDISIVKDGIAGWVRAGLKLFEGEHVPSKTLGELAFRRWRPKLISPEQLAKWTDDGRPFTFLDCRPPEEHQRMTVPGATCLPTGEIAHRLPEISGEAPVVLTCAGRTRGIIAACGLALIDPSNRYLTLENGTQGWVLSGRELEHGSHFEPMSELNAASSEKTSRAADEFMARFGIPTADAEMAAQFRDDPLRTTYFFDTRSNELAGADRLPAFVNVPAGQLVQRTDAHAGVLRSRMVLADDLGMRSAFAAFWLRALGHQVYVARIDDAVRSIHPAQTPVVADDDFPEISALDAIAAQEEGANILDFRTVDARAKARVKDSVACTRSAIRIFPRRQQWLIVDDGGSQTMLAAREFRRWRFPKFALISGGQPALSAAGAIVEEGSEPDPMITIEELLFAGRRHDGDLDDSLTYLNWEKGLVARLTRTDRAMFNV